MLHRQAAVSAFAKTQDKVHEHSLGAHSAGRLPVHSKRRLSMGAERSPEPAEATVEVSCQIQPVSQHPDILNAIHRMSLQPARSHAQQACASPSHDMKKAPQGPDSNAACCMPVAHSGIGRLLTSGRCGSEIGMGSCIADASMRVPSAILYFVPGNLMLCARAIMPSHALRGVHLNGDGLLQPFVG